LPRSPRNNLVVVRTAARRELEAAIRRYIDITNERLKPFTWTKTAQFRTLGVVRLRSLRPWSHGPDCESRCMRYRTGAGIKTYKDQRRAAGKAHAPINRELAALRRAFAIAVEQERLSAASVPRVKLFAEHNARQGSSSVRTLIPWSPGSRRTYRTTPGSRMAPAGARRKWRRSSGRPWTRRRLGSRCGAEHSKNGEPRVLPLVGELAEIIDRRRQDPYVHTVTGETAESRYIFHRNGGRIDDFRKAWTAACIAAGFAKPKLRRDGRPVLDRKGQPVMRATLIFHDLRRSAVRNLMAAGVNQSVAMRATGHQRAPDHQRLSALPDRLRRRRARGARADASRARERRRGPGAGWAGAQFGARNGSRDTLAGSKSLISKAGSWCSLVSTLDCQSRGRGFKSRRARHQFQ
jgi:hypothetical protein